MKKQKVNKSDDMKKQIKFSRKKSKQSADRKRKKTAEIN